MSSKKENHLFTQKQKKGIALAAVIGFLILSGIIAYVVGRPMIRFVRDPQMFRLWIDSHGLWGDIVYVGMVCLQVLVAIIPGEPLEICGGYAFGALRGTVLCLIGAMAGSLLVFAFVRRWGREIVEIFFSKEKLQNLRFLQSSPKHDLLFVIIFALPGTPKDLLCYAAGLTNLSWTHWLLICSLGRLPSIITSTVGGNALGTQEYLKAVIVFAVTMGVSIIGLLFYQWMSKRHEKKMLEKEKEDHPE